MKNIKFLALFLIISTNTFAISYQISQTNNSSETQKRPTKPPAKKDQQEPIPSLRVVQEELSQAEKDFEIAKKMFNPWYGGPLITGSGATLPKGLINVQPYIYYAVNYAAYDGNRKSNSIKNITEINPKLNLAVGITDRIDIGILIDWLHVKRGLESSNHFADTTIGLDIGIIKETPFIPGLKFTLSESFPTGKYEKFNPTKAAVESSGSGSYETSFALTTSKVVWWSLLHPMVFRFSVNFTIPTKVNVSGFNSYGGGFGTRGTITPGNEFFLSFGYEFSVYQKFVLAIDLAYEYQNKSTFKGTNGTILGLLAPVGARSKDVLSLAPAIEYNFSENLSLISGAWFSLRGRNTANFATGIITLTYTF
ncbi:MAG: hypothetical protein K1060chlam3_00284 [Candidatus Anoxychlamydiales bacterium]|nr:hypothetical protein [Candidatus Anoxychlamydiales bacterium]